MKKVILAMVLTFVALDAEDTVKYDTKDVKDSSISRPNYPNDDIYLK